MINNQSTNQPLPFLSTKNQIDTNTPHWEWYQSKFVLSQTIQNKEVFWNTSPSVLLHDPNMPNIYHYFDVTVKVQKMFNYEQASSWNWHKSWILPQINVEIRLVQQFAKLISLPQNTFISIYAVKADNHDSQNFSLVSVGLQGINRLKAEIGKNLFTTLKFNSTSFKHQGARFNLLIIIAVQSGENKLHEIPHILWSFISPPIFVDSRKTTRKNQISMLGNSVYSEFSPKYLNFQMYKKRSKESQIITKDLQGMINYFKAPNIRNKVKNPLFLCYRFSDCLTLYYNSQKITSSQEILSVCLKEFRNQLNRIHCKTNYDKMRIQCDRINLNALICICVNAKSSSDKIKFKELLSKFGSFDNSLINFIFEPSILSNKFVKVESVDFIKNHYQEQYCKSKCSIFVKQQPSYESQDEELISNIRKDNSQKKIKIEQSPNKVIKQQQKNLVRRECSIRYENPKQTGNSSSEFLKMQNQKR